MTFTVNQLSRCAGGNHIDLTITVGAQARTIHLLQSDLTLEPDELRDAVITRVRSAVKESGATTAAEVKAAIEGQTYRV